MKYVTVHPSPALRIYLILQKYYDTAKEFQIGIICPYCLCAVLKHLRTKNEREQSVLCREESWDLNPK